MSSAVYDSRFFVEHFYNPDVDVKKKIREEVRRTRRRYISTIVIHEVYRLSLEKEGREVARTRVDLMRKDFRVVDVSAEIAILSAELRKKYNLYLADSVIAATSQFLNARCVSDDPHFALIKEARTKWI